MVLVNVLFLGNDYCDLYHTTIENLNFLVSCFTAVFYPHDCFDNVLLSYFFGHDCNLDGYFVDHNYFVIHRIDFAIENDHSE